MQFNLSARPPFRFLSVAKSHGWVQLAPFAFDEETFTLSYIDRLSNGRVLEYRIAGTADGDGVTVETGKLTKAEQAEVSEHVSWMLGLDMDFSDFYTASQREPKLVQAEKLARGRVLRSPTLFEDVVKTILTTNTLWAATKRMNLNLINQYGPSLEGGIPPLGGKIPPLDGKTEKRAFPSPVEIAASSPEVLREAVRVGYRAPAIYELAVRTASGELDLESLKTSDLPTLELRKELLKIKGVGPYAAANLLLILGRGDFIPVDSWALKLVSHEWYNGEPVTPKQVEEAFEEWGEFKGLAFWFWDWRYEG
jgi:3-methyladenine DNA glycosylase/8-oxoguanine DNA glycosylase